MGSTSLLKVTCACPSWAARRIDAGTPANVDRFVEQRESEGASHNTIGKELTALVQTLKLAKRAGAFPGDISALRPVGFSIDYVPRERWLTVDEVRQLRDHLVPARFAFVAWIIATNCRLSEARRARREDVDFDRWTVRVRGTKTEQSRRTIPVLELYRPLLVEALPHLPLRWPRITHELPEKLAELGLAPATPNDLRRTHSSWLVQGGVHYDLVSKMLGHVNPNMLRKVYGQIPPEVLGRLIEAQIGASSSASQSRPDGGVCAGRPREGKTCLLQQVAPPGVEPGCPEGRRILKPIPDGTEDLTAGNHVQLKPPVPCRPAGHGTAAAHSAEELREAYLGALRRTGGSA